MTGRVSTANTGPEMKYLGSQVGEARRASYFLVGYNFSLQ